MIPSQLRGWRFIKLKARDKIPVEKDWPHHTYSWDDPTLLAWIERGGNYGVVGDESHVIIDADTPEVQQAVETYLPPTFTVRTPGHLGRHYYYLASVRRPLRLRDRQGKNVGDVQGPGKQVVGPGCIHPNGGTYKIIRDLPPARTTEEAIREALSEFLDPDWARAQWERNRGDLGISILDVHPLNGMTQSGDEFYGAHPVHGSETGRNFWLNPSKNIWHCFRHDSGGGPLSLLAVKEGIIRCEEARPGALRGPVFKRVLKIAEERGLISAEKLHEARRRTPISLVEIAEGLKREFRFVTHRESHEIWVYRDGRYVCDGEELIRERTRAILGEDATRHRVAEVLAHIRDTTFVEPDRFNPPLELVNVGNGILNILSGELKEHTPDIIFTNKLPVEYRPHARCPRIMEFLSQILYPEDIPVLQEFVGFCLYRQYTFARALMLLGSGRNGKSTLLGLITALLGPENVATLSLQRLVSNRFAPATLFGKLANIHADLPSAKLASTGVFKMLTGGDRIPGEKKFRDPFSFVNYAKLLFSANELPATSDLSDAFWHRWIVIECPNTFPEDDPRTDPHLLRKLTAPDELSGFLNWALTGLRRLLNNNGFSASKTMEEVKRRWILQTDSLRAFVSECVEQDPNGFVSKEEFYNAYQEFCAEHAVGAIAMNTVGQRLPTLVRVRFGKRTTPLGRKNCWIGIRLKD